MEINTFENFKNLKLIGEGSFGKVYKAENESNTVVALKILTKVRRLLMMVKNQNS